ncbi:MAG: aminoglycoside phosphotransferase family protein [Clostridiales bacterium]|nr:aminoglycoside phosphotransferase family protein [Clostridiales bacterium]
MKEIAYSFAIIGDVISVEPYGEGHINRTYLVTTDKMRYILQRMNENVFVDIDGLMQNIVKVTEFIKSKGMETLSVVPTKDGKRYLKGGTGFYRMYEFIENTVTYQTVTDKKMFELCGEAFGNFQNALKDFNAALLTETIPYFHDTRKRYRDFIRAVKADVCGRAETCKDEIEFITKRKDTYGKITDMLKSGELPLRVTHNDTKLNNVLIDADSGKPRAVIDLDTVMPGSLLYDFGDGIRFGASTAKEDEKDLDKVHFSPELYEAYKTGFLRAANGGITEKEMELLPYSAYLMTIECGMRFLTDYLCGDIYFATKYVEHNLVRARTQLKLASEMENNFRFNH